MLLLLEDRRGTLRTLGITSRTEAQTSSVQVTGGGK